jgi:hypothetical protein
MKKLFLLPFIALVAVMAVSSVSALGIENCSAWCAMRWESICPTPCTSYTNYSCPSTGCSQYCPGCSNPTCFVETDGNCVWNSGSNSCTFGTPYSIGTCIPEFTSIGAGIALIGAGAGYALIRRKLKK